MHSHSYEDMHIIYLPTGLRLAPIIAKALNKMNKSSNVYFPVATRLTISLVRSPNSYDVLFVNLLTSPLILLSTNRLKSPNSYSSLPVRSFILFLIDESIVRERSIMYSFGWHTCIEYIYLKMQMRNVLQFFLPPNSYGLPVIYMY